MCMVSSGMEMMVVTGVYTSIGAYIHIAMQSIGSLAQACTLGRVALTNVNKHRVSNEVVCNPRYRAMIIPQSTAGSHGSNH